MDYRGEWKARFKPTGRVVEWSHKPALSFPSNDGMNIYEKEENLLQVIFLKLPDVKLLFVDELNNTVRGEGGFGSTNQIASL